MTGDSSPWWFALVNSDYGPYKRAMDIAPVPLEKLHYFVNLRRINYTPDRALNSLLVLVKVTNPSGSGRKSLFKEANFGPNNRGSGYPMYSFLPELLSVRETGGYTAMDILAVMDKFFNYAKMEEGVGQLVVTGETPRGEVIVASNKTCMTFAPITAIVISKKLADILGIASAHYEELKTKLNRYDFDGSTLNAARVGGFWADSNYVRIPKQLNATSGSYGNTVVPRVTALVNE